MGEEVRVIAKRPINVRRLGHKDAEIVAQLPTGTIIDIMGKPNVNNYAEVVIDEFGSIPGAVRGWIWLGFTEPVKPDKELVDK